jgi:hypothetical protein
MTRKLVQTGSSPAVTLPREVVEQFKLKKGDAVEVSVLPQSGAAACAIGVHWRARVAPGGNVCGGSTDIADKAAALMHSLALNLPFVDGKIRWLPDLGAMIALRQ